MTRGAGQKEAIDEAYRVVAAEDLPLPRCDDVEQGLVGLLLMRNDLHAQVADVISSEHFADENLMTLFDAIGQIAAAGGRANPITLKAYLGQYDVGDGRTPGQYLAELAGAGTEPVNAMHYARMIRDFAAKRTAILSARRFMLDLLRPGFDTSVDDILRDHEDRVERLRPKISRKAHQGFRAMRHIAPEAMLEVEDQWAGRKKRKSLATGYAKLDAKIGGLAPGDLFVLAGRPSHGKTSLAVDVAVNVAIDLRRKEVEAEEEHRALEPDDQGVVAMFSLEMPEHQLAERIMARIAQVNGAAIRRRLKLTKDEVYKLNEAAREMASHAFMIDDTPGLAITQILARARALHRKKPIRLLVIDYLQLIQGFLSRHKDSKRNEEISEITAALKGLAKELACPVILLSQVSREVDRRDNRRPGMADLSQSASIEQDADQIAFVYREEVYCRKEQPIEGTSQFFDWERRLAACQGLAEIIFAKNRGGNTGMLLMGYNGALTHFLNEPVERDIPPEEPKREARGKKEDSLPAISGVLYHMLKGAVTTIGRPPTPEEIEREAAKGKKLPARARLVDRAKMLKQWHEDRMPEKSEKEALSAFTTAMDKLIEKGLTAAVGSREDGLFIYLPKLIGE